MRLHVSELPCFPILFASEKKRCECAWNSIEILAALISCAYAVWPLSNNGFFVRSFN